MRDPPVKQDSLEKRMREQIADECGDVFLRADFAGLGSYGQVGRALRTLMREGCLIRIGQGLYARAILSSLDGQPFPVNGLRTLTDALHRLGVETTPSRADRAYNSGVVTRTVRSCTTLENISETRGFVDHAAAMSFSLAVRSGRKMPSGWGSRIQS